MSSANASRMCNELYNDNAIIKKTKNVRLPEVGVANYVKIGGGGFTLTEERADKFGQLGIAGYNLWLSAKNTCQAQALTYRCVILKNPDDHPLMKSSRDYIGLASQILEVEKLTGDYARVDPSARPDIEQKINKAIDNVPEKAILEFGGGTSAPPSGEGPGHGDPTPPASPPDVEEINKIPSSQVRSALTTLIAFVLAQNSSTINQTLQLGSDISGVNTRVDGLQFQEATTRRIAENALERSNVALEQVQAVLADAAEHSKIRGCNRELAEVRDRIKVSRRLLEQALIRAGVQVQGENDPSLPYKVAFLEEPGFESCRASMNEVMKAKLRAVAGALSSAIVNASAEVRIDAVGGFDPTRIEKKERCDARSNPELAKKRASVALDFLFASMSVESEVKRIKGSANSLIDSVDELQRECASQDREVQSACYARLRRFRLQISGADFELSERNLPECMRGNKVL